MNTLIITAHPASYGFTHRIADTYKQEKEKQGGTVDVVDLYQDKRQEFLSFENLKDLEVTAEQKYYQAKITWADEIVLVYPIWWGSMPAIMKNWFDWNFSSHFAFRYTSEGKQEKLLTGKTARIFVTADGPRLMYRLVKPMMSLMVGKGILGFCGIKQQSFDAFPQMVSSRNVEAREVMLELVRKRAR